MDTTMVLATGIVAALGNGAARILFGHIVRNVL